MARKLNLSQACIDRLVDDITAAVPTERVYIFGSYARGDEMADSDIDLYVVTSDDKEKPFEYGKRVRMALPWINPWAGKGTPKDLDVLTAPAAVFDQRKEDFSTAECAVWNEGVKIYG